MCVHAEAHQTQRIRLCSSADHAAVDFVHAQVPRDMKMRVLVAAGGGDAVLSLLTNPHVATVASVSSSGAQHHLTTLKLALALSDLPTEAIIKALGMEQTADPVNPDAAGHRAELFSTSVLPTLHKLNPSSAAFWQDRIAREVAFGEYSRGTSDERYMQAALPDLCSTCSAEPCYAL
jgi:Protein of unknown function (DUF3419)